MDQSSSIGILDILSKLQFKGKMLSPRGQKTVELENAMFTVDYPFSSFTARNYSLTYTKKEMLWYLSADPFNEDILKAAPNWENFRQKDGRWLSNYGVMWFGEQNGFKWVVDSIKADYDTRQAIIPMISKNHLFEGNPDVVCTESISFRVREGRLNMSVNMRSNDGIWGTGNDLPCFWWLWEMVSVATGIPRGVYVHKADSFHVYEKHFIMLEDIVDAGMDDFYEIKYPPITDTEDLLSGKFESPFGKWLQGN